MIGKIRSTLAHGSVGRSGLWLLVATATASVLGYLFWFLLARWVDATQVGEAAAFVAVVAPATTLVVAGLVPTLTSAVARAGDTSDTSAVVSAGLSAAAVGSLFYVLPAGAVAIGGVVAPLMAAALVAAVIVSSVAAVLDAVFVAMTRSASVLVRVTVAGSVRLGGLAALAAVRPDLGAATVVGLWAAAVGLSLAVAMWRLRRGGVRLRGEAPGRHLGPMARSLGWNHLATVTGQLPVAALPLLVLSLAGGAANAGFYLALLLAGACFMVPAATTPALLAAASVEGRRPAAIRSAVRFCAVLLVPAMLGTAVVGPWLLSVLGSSYAQATVALWLLVAAAPFDAATALAVAAWRASGRERRAAVLNSAIAVVAIATAIVCIPRWGASGAALSFAVAQAAGTVALPLWRD